MACKYCKGCVCENDACPLFGDYCPVVGIPDVCKHEAIEPLDRFIEAQKESYADALKEIKAGHKETHWMWWIFPQYKGLGVSEVARHYAIQSKDEARAYWEHPVLGKRLRECMRALLSLDTNNADEVFGGTDAKKLRSCMTLFYLHGGRVLCGEVLEKFFQSGFDWETITLLLKG